ncbi:MAG: UBP-type zinc finger domain-containing protein [Gammaproteobacteria bacterium]
MKSPCDHLTNLTASNFPPPNTPNACEDCLREGTQWIALRECQTCGHVGCCDSSPRRHATQHFHETAHPVMHSVMARDSWTWCYVHQVYGKLRPPSPEAATES